MNLKNMSHNLTFSYFFAIIRTNFSPKPMKNNTKTTLKIFWKGNLRYPWLLIFILVGIIGASTAETITPLFYKDFFDKMTQDLSIIHPQTLIHILVYILFINLAGQMFWRLAIISASISESKVFADLSNFCFKVLHGHSFSFFNNNFVGSLTKKVNRFTRSYESIIDRIYWDFFPLVLGVGIILFVLFSRNFWLGLILISWCILFVTLNFLFIKFKYKYDLKRSELDSKVTGLLADTITNNSNIKLFCGTQRENTSFINLNEELRRIRTFVWTIGSIFQGVQGFLMVALEVGIFYLAIGLKQKGVLTLGDFVLIQTYLIQIFSKIWNFGHILQKVYEDLAEADEMAEIINLPPGIIDIDKATHLQVTQGAIDFKNVVFQYNDKNNILNSFNLAITPGQRIALVGPSGAGKTTVIKLLLRIHDLKSGEILIDGQNIAAVTQDSLHQNVSLVPQDPILFHRTLKENIRYGKPEATDEEVYTAAKLAHCDEFIKALPEGYNTYVGERGIKLSGGERQRVAIARAILRNAPILVLDEATSSLDSESEKLIQNALDVLMKNKTVIVIAHRLSTIMKMDRIVVIAKGNISESGTHTELLQNIDGLYKKLWEMQAGGFIK